MHDMRRYSAFHLINEKRHPQHAKSAHGVRENEDGRALREPQAGNFQTTEEILGQLLLSPNAL